MSTRNWENRNETKTNNEKGKKRNGNSTINLPKIQQ
jgi:hypothetical protein